MNTTIEAYFNKKKVHQLLLAGLFMTCAAVAIIGIGIYNFASGPLAGIVVIAFGVFATTFFGFAFIGSLRFLKAERLALVVNDKGIIDQSAVISIGALSWDEIEHYWVEYFDGKPLQVNYILTESKWNSLSKFYKAVAMLSRMMVKFDFATNFNLLSAEPDEIIKVMNTYKFPRKSNIV